MRWFGKRSRPENKSPEPVPARQFKAVHWTADKVRNNPDIAPIEARVEQLAASEDGSVSAVRAVLSGMDTVHQVGVPLWLGLPPITSGKVANLSLLMFGEEFVAKTADLGLWQLLLSDAKPDQLALLERIATQPPTPQNYEAANQLLSTLMSSALGRSLKAGEIENVRRLIYSNLGLSPEQVFHA